MSVILSIESSTGVCSVALHEQGRLLAAEQLHVPQSHASKLALLVQHVLESAGVESSGLSAVAVASGPGSYTGLRIGTSLAKGLCMGLSIPLISLDSLLVLANHARRVNPDKFLMCPMIDARRMEVYCSIIDYSLKMLTPNGPMVVDERSFNDILSQHSILFFGDGAEKCKRVIDHSNAKFLEGVQSHALAMGDLAFDKFINNEVEDVHQFVPNYGKDYEAKVSRVQIV